MSAEISVIIPTLNEEHLIEETVASALASGASEVIVSDGGSSDATLDRARRAGAVTLRRAEERGSQLNAGAGEANGPILLFLHADTQLPGTAGDTVRKAIDDGLDFGGFRISFIEPSPRLRLAAALINFRSRLTRSPWGDQAQFLSRDTFQHVGGYREIPIMEDYDLALRMKARYRTGIVPDTVRTSGRRFLEKGLFATAWMNWRIIIDWHRGVPPGMLARRYRQSAEAPPLTEVEPTGPPRVGGTSPDEKIEGRSRFPGSLEKD